MRILVVEDDRGYLVMLRKYLQGKDNSVTTADNGEQGLETYLNNPKMFDVILTDDQMPKMTGTEMIGQIRENGFKVPIIILSATVNAVNDAYLANDVYAILEKPIEFAKLDAVFKGVESKIENARTVLYIEDNKTCRNLMKQVLEQFDGIHVLMAESAEEGIELAKKTIPELIFIDIKLPDMNGIDALKLLKSNSTLKNAHMIALSTQAMTEQVELALGAGFDDYITKPVDLGKIYKIVEGL